MARKILLGGVAFAAPRNLDRGGARRGGGGRLSAHRWPTAPCTSRAARTRTSALRVSRADRNQLQVDVGDNGSADFSFDLTTFDAIDVEAGNGNDTVRIDQANGIFETTEATRLDGQNGDDTLIGGSGNEVLVGGRGDDDIDGNAGADTAVLGQGDDTFVWDPGDGSDVIEGGKGFDTMVFNGAGGNEIMAAIANFGRVSFTRNLGGIVMDLDGVEAIDVNALGGTDTVTVNDMSGTDLRRSRCRSRGGARRLDERRPGRHGHSQGTKGDDSIAADANGNADDVSGLAAFVRITHADPDKDTLVIDPAATGNDDVTIDPALAALIQVTTP